MTIEALTGIIIADAETEAARIGAAAVRERDKALDDARRQADALTAELVKAAEEEIERDKKRRSAAAELAARDKVLSAKQELIEKVFDLAGERLSEVDEGVYVDLCARLLAENAAGGEEAIFDDSTPPSARNEIVDRANRGLAAVGKTPVAAAEQTRRFGKGFILHRDRIELSFAFDRLVGDVRDELEPQVVATLFSDAKK